MRWNFGTIKKCPSTDSKKWLIFTLAPEVLLVIWSVCLSKFPFVEGFIYFQKPEQSRCQITSIMSVFIRAAQLIKICLTQLFLHYFGFSKTEQITRVRQML